MAILTFIPVLFLSSLLVNKAIWGFYGSLGSGKDTTTNYFLKQQSDKGRKIVTHVKLALPHIHMSIDDIFQKAINQTEFFTDKILYLSEFHLIVDARRSNAAVNVEFSQMLLIQLGKIDCDLFYTAQLTSQIDLRIKEMQKYFFFCTKKFRFDVIMDYAIKNNLSMEKLAEVLDFDKRIVKFPNGSLVPFDIKLEVIICDGHKEKVKKATLPWEILQGLFGNFNTREIIKFDRQKYLKS